MPQTIAQRRYWANRRKREQAQAPKKPKVRPALLATSVEEYDELRREHPDMQVNLRLPDKQSQLFDTTEYRDV